MLRIGPIGRDGTAERKHADLLLHSLIKHVLENGEFGYKVKRADEDADPGMIGDRVVSDIINSDLVVADLTDLNPNAFYELGIRHSTEKPTIHVAKLGTTLPFDNITHRTIFVDLMDWHSIETARTRLGDSARAVRSPEYKVSNPITQANASFRMRQSEDPRDRLLAEMQERMSNLESTLTKAKRANRKPEEEEVDEEFEKRNAAFDLLFSLHADAQAMRRKKMTDSTIIERLSERADDHRFSNLSLVENMLTATIDGIEYGAELNKPAKT